MNHRILVGDCRDILATLPERSVQTCVTSPPYFGLRDYNVPGQIGLETTLADYIAEMVAVMREVKRVLRDDGTLWLNIGDSYAGGNYRGGGIENASEKQRSNNGTTDFMRRTAPSIPDGLKPKDLMLVPARLAIALVDDGWYLRSDIIWAKPNPMPESVRDRPTNAHEHIFLLTKSAKYFYDADAIREPVTEIDRRGNQRIAYNGKGNPDERAFSGGATRLGQDPAGRNARNVWAITPKPFKDAHFATFPPELPERCIKAGTSERGGCPDCGAPWVRVVERTISTAARIGGPKTNELSVRRDSNGAGGFYDATVTTTGWQPSCGCDAGEPVPQIVLDPFLGSGTTLLVADRLGRDGIGIELNPEYAAMARKRITGDAPMFAHVDGGEGEYTPINGNKQDALGKNT